MALISNFFIAFIAALIGVIPPGLLNMYAAKISMKEGRKNGLLFSVGVCVTVMLQTYIALLFARYIEMNPEVVDMLQKVALGIFICLSIYFFFIAKDTRRELPADVNHSKTNRFFLGLFLAVLNVIPLPYWVYISITFSAFQWFTFDQPALWAAVVASGMGTFVMLSIYVQFFRPKDEPRKLKMNMNYLIGIITTAIAAITFFKILKDL